MPTHNPIAFIGIGIMGFHMARRLAEAGYAVSAWNRTPGKAEPLKDYGAQIATSAVDAVTVAKVAIVMVADGPSSDEVILGNADKERHSGATWGTVDAAGHEFHSYGNSRRAGKSCSKT